MKKANTDTGKGSVHPLPKGKSNQSVSLFSRLHGFLLLMGFATTPVWAADSVTITAVDPNPVALGGLVNIKAKMPIAQEGAIAQEIVQEIDPSKIQLKGLSDITYPAGWTLSFCSTAPCASAGNFTTTIPTNWANVRAVKASGSVISGGQDAATGGQIATGISSGSLIGLPPQSLASSDENGDGYQAFFDPDYTRVFNIYHHDAKDATTDTRRFLDCHVLATGETCAGFPFAYGGGSFSGITGRVITDKIWIVAPSNQSTADTKMFCVDISAVLASGGEPARCGVTSTAGIPLHAGTSDIAYFVGASTAGERTNKRLWLFDNADANIYCFDTATASTCDGVSPIATGLTPSSSPASNAIYSGIMLSGDRLYVSDGTPGNSRIACLKTDGNQCFGWTGVKSFAATGQNSKGKPVELPNKDGNVIGACYLMYSLGAKCWGLDGYDLATNASVLNLNTVFNATTITTVFAAVGEPMRVGNQVVWGNSAWYDAGPGVVGCWDASKNNGTGGVCNTSFPTGYRTYTGTSVQVLNYNVTPDPRTPGCLWVTTDHSPGPGFGIIGTLNINTGGTSCAGLIPPSLSFGGTPTVPQLACDATNTTTGESSITEWRSYTLNAKPSATAYYYSAVLLTVKNSLGVPIPGWEAIPLTQGQTLSLAGLTPEETGPTPDFSVEFIDLSGSALPTNTPLSDSQRTQLGQTTASVVAVGDPPELCMKPTATTTCPVGAGPGPWNTTTISATGKVTIGTGLVALTPDSAILGMKDSNPSLCSNNSTSLRGQALLSGGGGPLAGVVVTLLNSSGSPILVNGLPVTATTDANGGYEFPSLYAGTYKVSFPNSPSAAVQYSSVAAGGSGTSSAVNGVSTSYPATLTVATPGVVNAVYASLPSDMSVSLNGFPSSVTPGETVTGQLTCINEGPYAAQNATCNATGLPAGASVTCYPNSPQETLPVGGTMSCTVIYQAPATPVTLVGNTNATNDSVASNNTATLNVAGPVADMAVSITGFPSSVTPGQKVYGTVSCLNLGPDPAVTPSCAVTGLPAGASVVCAPNPAPNPLQVGGLVSCAVSYTAGNDPVTVIGTTNAGNDNNSTNNVASELIGGPTADMSVALSGFPTTPIAPGAVVKGTMTCTNHGPEAADNAMCTAAGLPLGATVTCTPASPQGSLAPGGIMTCAVSYMAPNDPVNLVGITSANNDSIAANNTANIMLGEPLADMSVALSGFPTLVTTGQTVTGTVTCLNNGPTTAQNAFCNVMGLPAGAQVSCTPASPQATFAVGSAMVCSVSYVAPNPATNPVTVVGVTDAENDGNANNNIAMISPEPAADMAAALSGFPASAPPGATVTGIATCVNNGPGESIAPICNVEVSGLNGASPTVTCDPSPLPGTLPVGGVISCAVSYVATSEDSIIKVTTGGSNDTNQSNNTVSQPLTAALADMSVALSGFPQTVYPGQTVSGVVTCLNQGPQAALSASCNVSGLPAGSTVSCTPNQLPIASLAVGSSVSCLVTYTGQQTPVTVTGTTNASNDPNLINNTASQRPGPVSDMSVALSGFPTTGNLTPGSTYTGQVTCTNNGPSAATNAFCDVNLPGATVTCTPASPQGSVAVGATMRCAVSFQATSAKATVMGITGATNDSNASNNTVEQVVPSQAANIRVNVTGFPPTAPPGSRVTGTVTCTSDGQVAANNAYCNISGLPPGATVSCSPSNTAATLPVGQSLVCQVSYVMPASGTVNIVAITGATNDPDTAQHRGVAPTQPYTPVNPIPTLGEWGRIIMMLMMLGLVWGMQRRVWRF